MLKPQLDTVHYPASDGEPMAENDITRNELIDAVKQLGWWFEDRQDVYVSGNLFIYYVPSNPRKRVAPDTFVVFGVHSRERDNFKIWEEGKVPAVVIEIVSDSNWKHDFLFKKRLYQRLGVNEYYMFDPEHLHLVPPLQGFHLSGRRYRNLGKPPFFSDMLGLEVFFEKNKLRFRDLGTMQVLRTPDEERRGRLLEKQGRLQVERLLQEERSKRLQAEDEVRRLRERPDPA